jgi:hypothetical protein
VDAFVEGCLRVVPGLDAIAGIGGEELFSPTYDIGVGKSHVGILPPARATLQGGVRIRF